MEAIAHNAVRLLRGLYIFRLLLILFFVILILPIESQTRGRSAGWLALPTLALTLYLFVPGLERRLGRRYLPIALVGTIAAISLESAVAYTSPGARVLITLRSGRELSQYWAPTEVILLILVPCVLGGAVYGLRGAFGLASVAALIHLAIGVAVWQSGGPWRSFLPLLPVRLAVLYVFPLIAGYLADTWRHEHAALAAANRQLRGYAAAIEQLATSRERVRLARDMHDTLAHSLSALVIQLEAVSALQESDPAAAAPQLQKVRQLARTGLDEARRAILNLRSAPVEELGLAAALERLVAQFGRQHAVVARFAVEGPPQPVPAAAAEALYRISEEALHNVYRHARAGQIALTLHYDQGVSLIVHDDGLGFDAGDVGPDRYGLLGIRERATLVGGRVTLYSAPQAGTTLTVEIAAAGWS